MLNKIEENCQRMKNKKKTQFYVMCDAILAGIVLRQDMARNISPCNVDVELIGSKTRGQIVVDHQQQKKTNVFLIDDFDSEILKEIIYYAVDPQCKSNAVLFPRTLLNNKPVIIKEEIIKERIIE